MTKYSLLLSFFALLVITGCQTEGQKAYADLLKKGISLSEKDTITAKVGDKLFYLYSYSAGVQPIYYTLKYYNSDSTVLQYVDDFQFYVGEEDISGGPSEGVQVFEAKKTGLVRLEFYNPYYNEIEYGRFYPEHGSSDRVKMEFYKTFTDSIALNDWTDAQYANYYDNWSKLPAEARDATLDTLFEKFNSVLPRVDTLTKTKVIKSFAKRYVFREAEITRMLLDSLFNLPNVDALERWQAGLKEHKENLPLHENLKTTVCYVKIED
jgi:hypothetical protein